MSQIPDTLNAWDANNLYKATDVADALGLPESSTWAMVLIGALPAWAIFASEYLSFDDEHTETTREPPAGGFFRGSETTSFGSS